MWGKRKPTALFVGMYICSSAMEIIWRFIKQLKMELPYDIYMYECICTYTHTYMYVYIDIYMGIRMSKRYLHSRVHHSTINSNKDIETIKTSMDG